jgi:hypothetical protein
MKTEIRTALWLYAYMELGYMKMELSELGSAGSNLSLDAGSW